MVTERVVGNSENAGINEQVALESGKVPIEQFRPSAEHRIERADNSPDEGISSKEQKSSGQPSNVVPQPSRASIEQEKRIENIMSEGLEELFVSLEPADQQKFREEGEQAAKKINALLSEGKIQIVKIFNLIKNWLSMLPGVNRYFLEQETKIKVDEIIQLKKGGEQ